MKVSIITATWNSEKTIKEAINSVNKQNYKNIEHIIIDGKSTDSTMNIVNQHAHSQLITVSEKDKGIYDALNKGISIATGEIIGFLHSDDFFANGEVISDIVNLFKESNSDAVYADLCYVSKLDKRKILRNWISGEYKIDKLKKGWMPPHPTFYMKKSSYKKYGFFDLNYSISADYDSMIRYLWIHKISLSYLPKVIIKMRAGGTSNSNLTNILKKTMEDLSIIKKNKIPVLSAIFGKNFSKLSQFSFFK